MRYDWEAEVAGAAGNGQIKIKVSVSFEVKMVFNEMICIFLF